MPAWLETFVAPSKRRCSTQTIIILYLILQLDAGSYAAAALMALHSFSPRSDALQQTHPEPRLLWICGLAGPQARHEERYAFACALPLQALIWLYLP